MDTTVGHRPINSIDNEITNENAQYRDGSTFDSAPDGTQEFVDKESVEVPAVPSTSNATWADETLYIGIRVAGGVRWMDVPASTTVEQLIQDLKGDGVDSKFMDRFEIGGRLLGEAEVCVYST